MKTYTRQEAVDASLQYFNGDKLAADVFVGKYALHDGNTWYELTPEWMHRRLAGEFARIEQKYPNPMSESEIFDLFDRYRYIVPQGSPMSGIGNPFQLQSLSNCFVIESPYDSYGGIFLFDQEEAQIMKRRGGVGGDVSSLRPRGMPTSNAAETSDGIGVFMERYSNTCREVAQGGRRGALMITVSVHHPDIETFINIKRDKKKVTGANISIRITDEFMQAVKDDRDYELRFPVDADGKKVTKKVSQMVSARKIWDMIIDAAHSSAEPGLLFWDRVTQMTPADAYADFGYRTISTNPCGELPLCAYDSCRLLLVNLLSFVIEPYTSNARFNWKLFAKMVRKAQRLMDDLIDLEIEMIDKIIAKIETDPEPSVIRLVELDLWRKVKKKTSDARRTGLGITALGDCLAALGIKYGSPLSIEVAEEIYKQLAINSYHSSCEMADERGAFPIFSHEVEKNHPFIQRVLEAGGEELRALYVANGRRNIANTTTAPGGSVSTQTQSTSGVEPTIFIEATRRKKINPNDKNSRVDFVDEMGDTWQEYKIYHEGVKRWMEATGETDVTKSPYWGATANEIDWVASVDLQAAAQKWVCHAISKTCNLPENVSADVVKQVYMRAWEKGCKGFTVYREGSRTGVIVQEKEKKAETEQIVTTQAPKRPKELPCDIHHVNLRVTETNEDGEPERTTQSWLVLVGLMDGKPYEVFCGLSDHIDIPRRCKRAVLVKNGKKDGVATYNLQIPLGDDDSLTLKDVVNLFANPTHGAFTRTLSLSLRHGVPIQFLVEQLQKDKHSDMMSFSRVIARVLKGYIPDGTKSSERTCPSCKQEGLAYQEGCISCQNCGYSKCG